MPHCWNTSNNSHSQHCKLLEKVGVKCSPQPARRYANDYWIHVCESIQLGADTGNIRGILVSLNRLSVGLRNYAVKTVWPHLPAFVWYPGDLYNAATSRTLP